jgi:hypothetical protein
MSKNKKNAPIIAASINNATEIEKLELLPMQESPSGFNFDSSLFV